MLRCNNCHHLVMLADQKNCEICFGSSIDFIDSSFIKCPQNQLFPKDSEIGYIPKLTINFDYNRKSLEIIYNYIKNRHLVAEFMDVYVNEFCMGRINMGISSELNTSVTFLVLNPKIKNIFAVLYDRANNNFWKIDMNAGPL